MQFFLAQKTSWKIALWMILRKNWKIFLAQIFAVTYVPVLCVATRANSKHK